MSNYFILTVDTNYSKITITGPDKNKISEAPESNTANFSFLANTDFINYKVCVVPTAETTQADAVTIGTANGSVNMEGTGTTFAYYPIDCSIKAADLKIASPTDGTKKIKVFVQKPSGLWSK